MQKRESFGLHRREEESDAGEWGFSCPVLVLFHEKETTRRVTEITENTDQKERGYFII